MRSRRISGTATGLVVGGLAASLHGDILLCSNAEGLHHPDDRFDSERNAMATGKKRIASIPDDLRDRLVGSSDDLLLAIHDLCHVEMERRHGSPRRSVAAAATD